MPATVPDKRDPRIDLVRGAAVVCMVQFHTIDSFASPATKAGWFGQLSVFFGGGAAPLFLMLAGVGAAYSRHNLARGVEVWTLGVLFRVQEWALGGDGASSLSLLRVDVLNCIGVSLVILAALPKRVWVLSAAAAFFILLAPIAVTTTLPYVGGTLFPVFPWTGIACAGAAFALSKKSPSLALGTYGLIVAARLVAPGPLQFDALNHNIVFTLERTALSIGLLAIAQLFPFKRILLQLGRHSLLIYWVHVELAYGLWFHSKKATLTAPLAAAAALAMLSAMWLLSYRGRRVAA